MRVKKPKVYFSFRSPYSWFSMLVLGKKGLGPANEELEYIPFFEPDKEWLNRLEKMGGTFHYTPMGKEKHLYILQDVKRLAKKFNVAIQWPLDDNPDWSIPHLVFKALSGESAESFFWKVYSDRWEKGLNIWTWEHMAEVLSFLKLNSDEIIKFAKGEKVQQMALDALYAIYRDGVFGVPYFIVNRNKFWGVDRVEDFLKSILNDAGIKIEANVDLPIFDYDHAGGCG